MEERGWGGWEGQCKLKKRDQRTELGDGARVISILSFYRQDLLELAETLGPARPQGLPQEGIFCILIVCIACTIVCVLDVQYMYELAPALIVRCTCTSMCKFCCCVQDTCIL